MDSLFGGRKTEPTSWVVEVFEVWPEFLEYSLIKQRLQ